MKVLVNDDFIDIDKKTNLHLLLKQLKIEHKSGIAIAVNEQIINKSKWDKFFLKENDKILIISASQGG